MAFRSAATNDFVPSPGDSVATAAVPDGAQPNDIAVAWLFTNNDVAPSAAGWTSLDGPPYWAGGGKGRFSWLWKRLTAADTGTYEFQFTGSSGGHGVWVALWSGRATTDPFDFAVANDIESAGDNNVFRPSELTGAASSGADLIYSFSNYSGTTPLTVHDPSTILDPEDEEDLGDAYTQRINNTNGDNLFTIDGIAATATRGAQADQSTAVSTWFTTFGALKQSTGTEPIDAAFNGATATAAAAGIHGSWAAIAAGQFPGALGTAAVEGIPGVLAAAVNGAFTGVAAGASGEVIDGTWDVTVTATGPAGTATAVAVGGHFSGNGTVFPLTITGLAGPNVSPKSTGPGRVPDPKTTGPAAYGAAAGPGIAFTVHGAGV